MDIECRMNYRGGGYGMLPARFFRKSLIKDQLFFFSKIAGDSFDVNNYMPI